MPERAITTSAGDVLGEPQVDDHVHADREIPPRQYDLLAFAGLADGAGEEMPTTPAGRSNQPTCAVRSMRCPTPSIFYLTKARRRCLTLGATGGVRRRARYGDGRTSLDDRGFADWQVIAPLLARGLLAPSDNWGLYTATALGLQVLFEALRRSRERLEQRVKAVTSLTQAFQAVKHPSVSDIVNGLPAQSFPALQSIVFEGAMV
jgi:hypothetical protein